MDHIAILLTAAAGITGIALGALPSGLARYQRWRTARRTR